MSSSLPFGTVTFLFCDIEGSTRLWEKHPSGMQEALARHDRILRQAIEENRGYLVKTTGDGFHAAFQAAQDALLAAFIAQKNLDVDAWKEIQPDVLRSRMALFTGEASARGGDYFGTAVNRAARLMSIGHGGQTLLSSTAADIVRDRLPDGATLLDLGEHRIRGLERPEHIFQLAHPALPSEFPPVTSLESFPNNLPVQLTSFIGREDEIEKVKELLGGSRLVTLIGPGGTGKTRLALQAAADLLACDGARSFPHGAWLVEFAAQVDPGLVVQTIAEVFHLREMPNSPPLMDLVIDFLRAKHMLLILDNCEHLIEACARTADDLLHACPGIKILASNREAFGISGEMIHRVPSLSIPQPERSLAGLSPSGTQQMPVEELMRYESARLFVERAAAAQPSFTLSERNAPAVTRICQRLDGIPLAIELAAARVKVFTPEQIAARLDDRFRLLTGGSRTALHRQQTLRALIDWSYDLLTPPEQALFRFLSVFTGGWSYEAAEAVSGSPEVLDQLTNLVNKSLVIVNEQGSEARYAFLETIRQYSRDKLLESGEAAWARDQHLACFLRASEQAEKNVLNERAVDWLDRLDADGENIRSAIEWALESSPEDALRLAGNLALYLTLRMNQREAQALIREALARAEALHGPHAEPGDDYLRLRARGLMAEGLITMNLGELASARPILEKAVEGARAAGDTITLHMSLGVLAVDCNFLNDPQAAKQAAQESLLHARKAGLNWAAAMSLGSLAWAEGKLGNDSRRAELIREMKMKAGSLDNPMVFDVQMIMGIEARIYGDLASARILLENCLQYVPLIRSVSFEAMIRSELAHIGRQEGDHKAARETYSRTLRMWMEIGHRAAIANQLECFAFLAAAQEQYERAARLLGAAEALRELIGGPMTDYEQVEYAREVSRLRGALPDPGFSLAWSAGRALGMDNAVSLALSGDSHGEAVWNGLSRAEN